MGTILCKTIINDVRGILKDKREKRWTNKYLTEKLSDGCALIVFHKPNAYVKRESVSLSAGTVQTLPAGGMQFLDVKRNMGTDGLTPGNAVTVADKRILDEYVPGWSSATQVEAIENYMFDERFPDQFENYPPADGTGQIEIGYSAVPPLCVYANPIPIGDQYKTPLEFFLLAVAYLKDTDSRNEMLASGYFDRFETLLGIRSRKESRKSPNFELLKNNTLPVR